MSRHKKRKGSSAAARIRGFPDVEATTWILLAGALSGVLGYPPWGVAPVPPEPVQVMTDVTNRLGVVILQDFSRLPGNVAFSPYGVASVLIVLWEGARGDSGVQLRKSLGLPSTLHPSIDYGVVRLGMRDIHRHLRSYFAHDGYLNGLTFGNTSSSDIKPSFRKILRFYGYDPETAMSGGGGVAVEAEMATPPWMKHMNTTTPQTLMTDPVELTSSMTTDKGSTVPTTNATLVTTTPTTQKPTKTTKSLKLTTTTIEATTRDTAKNTSSTPESSFVPDNMLGTSTGIEGQNNGVTTLKDFNESSMVSMSEMSEDAGSTRVTRRMPGETVTTTRALYSNETADDSVVSMATTTQITTEGSLQITDIPTDDPLVGSNHEVSTHPTDEEVVEPSYMALKPSAAGAETTEATQAEAGTTKTTQTEAEKYKSTNTQPELTTSTFTEAEPTNSTHEEADKTTRTYTDSVDFEPTSTEAETLKSPYNETATTEPSYTDAGEATPFYRESTVSEIDYENTTASSTDSGVLSSMLNALGKPTDSGVTTTFILMTMTTNRKLEVDRKSPTTFKPITNDKVVVLQSTTEPSKELTSTTQSVSATEQITDVSEASTEEVYSSTYEITQATTMDDLGIQATETRSRENTAADTEEIKISTTEYTTPSSSDDVERITIVTIPYTSKTTENEEVPTSTKSTPSEKSDDEFTGTPLSSFTSASEDDLPKSRKRRMAKSAENKFLPEIQLHLHGNAMLSADDKDMDSIWQNYQDRFGLPLGPFLVQNFGQEPLIKWVPMIRMVKRLPFAYSTRLQAKALMLPLDDERYKLLLVLPSGGDTDIENNGGSGGWRASAVRKRRSYSFQPNDRGPQPMPTTAPLLETLIRDLGSVPLREIIASVQPCTVATSIPPFLIRGLLELTPSLIRVQPEAGIAQASVLRACCEYFPKRRVYLAWVRPCMVYAYPALSITSESSIKILRQGLNIALGTKFWVPGISEVLHDLAEVEYLQDSTEKFPKRLGFSNNEGIRLLKEKNFAAMGQMGVRDVFDSKSSDLSGMTNSTNLWVRGVEQTVSVAIDVTGILGGGPRNGEEKYGAGTGQKDNEERRGVYRQEGPQNQRSSSWVVGSHPDYYERNVEGTFTADRPFVFFVVDTGTKVALMAGKVVDPTTTKNYS